MNRHYDPLLIIKYLKLDSQFPNELQGIERRDELFSNPPRFVPSDHANNDESDRGGSSGTSSLKYQIPSKDNNAYLNAKIALLKKTEAFARLDAHITESSDDKVSKYKEAAAFYTPYIEDHWELTRLYSIMRGRFRDDLMTLSEEDRNSEAFSQSVVDLLILGSILKGVHRHGLNVPRMTRMYLRDQKLLTTYLEDVAGIAPWKYELALMSSIESDPNLAKPGVIYVSENGSYVVRDSVDPSILHVGTLKNIDLSFLSDRFTDPNLKDKILDFTSKAGHTHWELEPILPKRGTQTVRDFHLQWNLFRLFWVRSRRFISLLALYWQGDFLQGFRTAELNGTLLFFSYLAWVFFLFRLLVNLGLIYKHVFDESAMTEVEKHLGWKVRLRAQLVRRWQELANDLAWFSSGITTCFFLANQIPAVGLYLAVAMQSYDLFVTTRRFMIEYRRLRKLKKGLEDCSDTEIIAEYRRLRALKKDPQADRQSLAEMRYFLLADIDKRMTFDLIELIYSWVNFLVLLVCAILMTQFFAGLSPIVPIAAALTTVAVTLVTYCVTRYIIYQRQKLYDGPLLVPDVRCVKKINAANSKIDLKTIDLGIFASAYLRVVDNQDMLVNIIYVNKQTEQMVDFLNAFCWKKSRTLSQLTLDEISEVCALLKENKNPKEIALCQEINERIAESSAEERKTLVFTVEETRLIMSVCRNFASFSKFDTKPAFTIRDLDSCLPTGNKYHVMIKDQQDTMLLKLKRMRNDVTKLKTPEKRPFWRDFTQQTSKSVYAFSGALLGAGGG